MKRKKRPHGEGAIEETRTGWECAYRHKYKTFPKWEFPTKREALIKFASWRKELDEQARAVASHLLTMGELFDRFLERLVREEKQDGGPKRAIRRYLRPALGEKIAEKLTLDDIDDYVNARFKEKTDRGRPPRPGTINRELSYITSSLRLNRPKAINLEIKKFDESDGIRTGLVSREDYELLLNELRPYYKPVWVVAWFAGVRQGELLKIRREWVDLTANVISVPGRDKKRGRVTKNAGVHYISLFDSSMVEMVRWAYDVGDPACPYLFQYKGRRIQEHALKSMFERARERIGRPDLIFHDTRRTAVTTMVDAGIRPEKAMAVSGHKDIRVFTRYAVASDARARKDVIEAGKQLARWHRANYGGITERPPEPASAVLEHDSKPN